MPNIGIHGYDEKRAEELKKLIIRCMMEIDLGGEAIWEIFPTQTGTCDGDEKPAPYLRIFSSDPSHIPLILAGFERYGVHEDTEVLPDMFFDETFKKEISNGGWAVKFDEEDLEKLPDFLRG